MNDDHRVDLTFEIVLTWPKVVVACIVGLVIAWALLRRWRG